MPWSLSRSRSVGMSCSDHICTMMPCCSRAVRVGFFPHAPSGDPGAGEDRAGSALPGRAAGGAAPLAPWGKGRLPPAGAGPGGLGGASARAGP